MTQPPINITAVVKAYYDQGFRTGAVIWSMITFAICVLVFT